MGCVVALANFSLHKAFQGSSDSSADDGEGPGKKKDALDKIHVNENYKGMTREDLRNMISREDRKLIDDWFIESGVSKGKTQIIADIDAPKGVSSKAWGAYLEAANRVIVSGLDSLGVQAARVNLMNSKVFQLVVPIIKFLGTPFDFYVPLPSPSSLWMNQKQNY